MSNEFDPPNRNEGATLREWLTTQRARAGLTQADLATRAKVTSVTISHIETGATRNPQPAVWQRIVEALRSVSAPQPQESAKTTAEAAAKAAKEAADAASQESKIEGIGELVDFEPHDEEDLPDEPGVYIFYDVTERPTYIGESGNIRNRIRGKHDEKFWYRPPIVQTAAYIKIDKQEERRKIEKLLITVLRSHALINKAHVQRGVGDEAE
jgi:transcriptional regulator with XRE-family HTH domain